MTTLHTVAATGALKLSWLLLVFPLFGAVVLLLGGRRTNRWGHLLGVAMPVAAFVYGLIAFFTLLGLGTSQRSQDVHLYSWIPVAGLQVNMNLLVDQLSICFVLLITGVGSLIIIYAVGYMSHDRDRRRFFGYMNLFLAAMLLLVLGDNFLVLYVGWEGVGLASYLLIGFWQYKNSAAVAAKKAFIVNRVGDAGLTLAIFLMFTEFGTVSFSGVFNTVKSSGSGVATALGLLLLLGACGKSAQVPLQSWLLDAMEGPTPVSALIHAATMVTAGVYLLVRSSYVFDYAPDARTVVVIVATVTLLYGAIIGCAKDDIKKVLAGSTMSQIGYMMLAAGIGIAGYPFAIFHLLNHGFFKADMFLGAGSVMHGMDDDVDMRHYGLLRKAMPVTFLTFSMGYLAIIGFPGFSGFWSKDRIIEVALDQNILVGVLAMIGAGITGFYMTRLMLMTFFTEKRWADEVHPHESPKVMTIPLIVLAALSVFGGVMLIGNWIVDFLEPVTGTPPPENPPIPSWAVSVIVVCIVAVGVSVAWFVVGKHRVPREAPQDVAWPVRAARAELYGNEVNDELVVKPGAHLVHGLTMVDHYGVDGVVEGGALAVGGVGTALRRTQTGFVRSYALSLVAVALLALNLA